MITENLSTLQIHKLTQEQYDRAVEKGDIDPNALYLTPDEEIDLSPYATVEQVESKVPLTRTVNGKGLDSDITLEPQDIGADTAGSAAKAFSDAKSHIATQLASMIGDKTVSEQISDAIASKSDTGHTHSYASSSSVGGSAKSAEKLNTNAGSSTQPIYFDDGVPVAMEYELHKTVPANAKFTDTTYSAENGIALSGTTFSNSGVRSVATGSNNGTISVNTNGTSNDVAVKGLGSAAYTNVDAYDASGSAASAQNAAKSYTDTQISTFVGDTPVSTQIANAVSDKVTQVSGKGLSTNDYTTAEKNKLAGIASGANAYTLPTASSSTLGGVKTTSAVTSADGYTPCPIVNGVPYYKGNFEYSQTDLVAGTSPLETGRLYFVYE